MTLQAVIFDLDDTLYLERDYAFSGFRAVAEAFAELLGDPNESTEKMQALFDSQHRHRVFNQILELSGRNSDDKLVRTMIDTYRGHTPTIQLLLDANEAIARLAPSYKLGLITDGPAIMQRAKIDALGLIGRIDEIIVTDELGPDASKPNPLAFEMIADALGVGRNECVYVADNVAKDFVAPNKLEWLTVQILRPLGVYKDVLPVDGGEPAQTITSLDELDRLLRQDAATS